MLSSYAWLEASVNWSKLWMEVQSAQVAPCCAPALETFLDLAISSQCCYCNLGWYDPLCTICYNSLFLHYRVHVAKLLFWKRLSRTCSK